MSDQSQTPPPKLHRTPHASLKGERVETLLIAGHTLTLTLPPEPVVVDADVTRLSQVFANLLNNAAKYTPNGGRIVLTASREPENVVISVRDNGTGIEAAMLPHVFDLFTQAERTPDRAQGGLGIGLALVKTIVSLHDGEVSAHSGKSLGSRPSSVA